jgi:outer membrane lipoprotein-sorting protein
MHLFRPLVLIGAAVWLASATGASAADDPLAATFTQMDSVAAAFKGLKADLRQVSHTEVVNEDTIDLGTITVGRKGPKDLRILVDITGPANPKKAFIGGNKVLIFYPKMNTVQEYDLGKASAMKDQLMMLAFGSNSRDLKSAYSITLGGPEMIGGQKATRIELVPKDKDLVAHFPKIELWISDQTGLTLQQKAHQPGGDYITMTYSKIQPMAIPEASLKLDLPKDVHREKPQKQ